MTDDEKTPSIVVSLRLPLNLAEAFRTEGARRNIRLNRIFEEMWRLYQANPALPAKAPPSRRRIRK